MTTWNVKPLKILFVTTKEEEARYKQFCKEIVSPLDQPEYIILPAATKEESDDFELRLNCEAMQCVLDRSNLQSEVTLVSKYELDLGDDLQWKRVSRYLKPKATYLGPENFATGKSFIDNLKEYRMTAPKFGECLSRLGNLPFRVSGAPFLGIKGLKDYRSGDPRQISNKAGITQIIVILNSRRLQRNQRCVRDLASAVS